MTLSQVLIDVKQNHSYCPTTVESDGVILVPSLLYSKCTLFLLLVTIIVMVMVLILLITFVKNCYIVICPQDCSYDTVIGL